MSIAKSIIQVSAAALLLGAFQAHAADGNFPVTSNVVQSCVLSVPSALNFGEYDPIGVNETTDKTGQATVEVKCSAGAPMATVYMSKGSVPAPFNVCESSTRRLYNGVSFLNYSLHQNADMVTLWGCQSGVGHLGGKSVGPFTSSLTPLSLTVYGKIVRNQPVPVGNYADTVNVWVSF